MIEVAKVNGQVQPKSLERIGEMVKRKPAGDGLGAAQLDPRADVRHWRTAHR